MRSASGVRHGVARVLSKAGLCSRTEAARWIQDGRVRVDGRVVSDPEMPIVSGSHRVEVDGRALEAPGYHYLMVNKPRGLVTSASDERGRDTVYRCLEGAGLPWVAPVGRLDRASEGLLLLSNDPAWAAAITDPLRGPAKTYHVQIDTVPAPMLLAALVKGMDEGGERLSANAARLLRAGGRNAWLEIVLDEGRNRHIRRLLAAHGVAVLRLVRVAIGPLLLGELGKGGFRHLETQEVRQLAMPSGDAHDAGS